MAKTLKLLIVLVLVALIGFFIGYSLPIKTDSNLEGSEFMKSQINYLEINKETRIPSTTNIVSDRFVKNFDPNSRTVVISSDGNIIDVKKGIVLTSGVLVDRSSEEKYNIVRLDKLRNSIYN